MMHQGSPGQRPACSFYSPARHELQKHPQGRKEPEEATDNTVVAFQAGTIRFLARSHRLGLLGLDMVDFFDQIYAGRPVCHWCRLDPAVC